MPVTAERRRLLVLGGLVVALAVVLYRGSSAPAGPVARPSNSRSPVRAAAATGQPQAPDVHLEALVAERPGPGDADRNLFRFAQRSPSGPAPGPPGGPEVPVVTPPLVTPGPGGAQPITLKFIGILERPEQGVKIAILSDGRGVPFHGKEGDVVAGRYRILRIGAESIEMTHLDGQGRQTIRLSGS
jgi:hypothetical protein